ncbi:hypothetical protein Droror1_Dr00012627 [Drosera rotundifolia]
MNWLKKSLRPCEEESAFTAPSSLDHEISQLTKIRSEPIEHLTTILNGEHKRPISTFHMLAAREGNYSGRGRFSSSDKCHVLSRYLPVNGPNIVDQMDSCAYVSQFSSDGSLLVAGSQGSEIRIYDVENRWKVHKDIRAKSFRWTITDTCLSPDQRYLVYSSMSPILHIVHIASTATESLANVTDIHDGLDLSGAGDDDYDMFGVFSVKFSGDGRELVASSNVKSIYIFDLEANKLALKIAAHEADVNSVCFADESGHLIYSGGDDGFCKVWDRRCLNFKDKPAGVLSGHLVGITYIDSRRDGRYFISNGKDQSIKLWDIRKMTSKHFRPKGSGNWDYRYMEYPKKLRDMKHPNDQSLATYKGHSVLRTLIRCHFSPEHSTGQKYIYTGSNDGGVYIYDLVTTALVAKVDHHKSTVRDCSWHPYYPTLISSSWDGQILRCEFPGNGETPPPLRRRTLF